MHAYARSIRIFILMLGLGIGLSGSVHAADNSVLDAVSPFQFERMLNELGYTGTEIDEDGDIVLRMQGYNVLVLVGSYDGVYVAMVGAFAGTQATLADVNTWNREKRFARAYLDSDGDPVIEAELDMAGGVTVARVKDFIQTFGQLSLPEFIRTVAVPR